MTNPAASPELVPNLTRTGVAIGALARNDTYFRAAVDAFRAADAESFQRDRKTVGPGPKAPGRSREGRRPSEDTERSGGPQGGLDGPEASAITMVSAGL